MPNRHTQLIPTVHQPALSPCIAAAGTTRDETETEHWEPTANQTNSDAISTSVSGVQRGGWACAIVRPGSSECRVGSLDTQVRCRLSFCPAPVSQLNSATGPPRRRSPDNDALCSIQTVFKVSYSREPTNTIPFRGDGGIYHRALAISNINAYSMTGQELSAPFTAVRLPGATSERITRGRASSAMEEGVDDVNESR